MTDMLDWKSCLRDNSLKGVKVRIVSSSDAAQSFTLLEPAGEGMKGITWKVKDCHNWPFALKFVAKEEYYGHPLETELIRVRELGARFAQIATYGDPIFDVDNFKPITNATYAIVIEWVRGESLIKYCKANEDTLDPKHFLSIASELCEILASLKSKSLSHCDLNEDNVMVIPTQSALSSAITLTIKIIDTGSLMQTSNLEILLERWRSDHRLLSSEIHEPPTPLLEKLEGLDFRIQWFSRGDQFWIVYHLCQVINLLRKQEYRFSAGERRFLRNLTPVFSKMIDQDASMRIEDPIAMYQELEIAWKAATTPVSTQLITPFDLISAELIRSSDQLNNLFSDKCPWLERCATTDPVYIYGPRGCGKSTILRKLSLPVLLADTKAKDLFIKWPYLGVYISCSSELRSRFWLFPKEMYPKIQADVILFFIMLLADSLLESLELLRDGQIEDRIGHTVGLTRSTEQRIAEIICIRFELPQVGEKLVGISWLAYARNKLALARNDVWSRILTLPTKRTPNPALLFDLCKDIEQTFPLLKEKHIAFLIDDYSNQRIPVELQRMLNQTISFAKQGNPIFKVSSEYQGVDLEGIQEGREVIEVNFGKEYVALTEIKRSAFLEDVFNIRFREARVKTTIEALLGRSGLSPGVPMARAIRKQSKERVPFYYHGIDTIADICSGDLAMALDLVKRIYVTVKDKIPLTEPVSARVQHDLIREYSEREHSYNRYLPSFGKDIAEIADRLCWLAHEAAVQRDSRKDGKAEPMIKTSIDIPLQVFRKLPADMQTLLQEMQRKGVLFSLDTSKTRIDNDGTDRFQVRRILLAKYQAPLARRDPIKIDDMQRLLSLLKNPSEFVVDELGNDGFVADPDQQHLL